MEVSKWFGQKENSVAFVPVCIAGSTLTLTGTSFSAQLLLKLKHSKTTILAWERFSFSWNGRRRCCCNTKQYKKVLLSLPSSNFSLLLSVGISFQASVSRASSSIKVSHDPLASFTRTLTCDSNTSHFCLTMTATVESSTPKPISKASEHRRITKPIMEKKRRARINNSLDELKSLILAALNKDPARHSKLEKADILEMTVRHLQRLQRQQSAVNSVNDQNVFNKFRAGYTECANEVSRLVHSVDGVDSSARSRITSHLSHCMNSLSQLSQNTTQSKPAFPGMIAPCSLQVQIPFDLNNNSIKNISTPPCSASSAANSPFAFPSELLFKPSSFHLSSPSSYGSFSPVSCVSDDIALDCSLPKPVIVDDNVWRPW